MGLLTDRINNKLEESNLINKHALNREPVPLILTVYCPGVLAMYIVNCGTSTPSSDELAPRNFEKTKASKLSMEYRIADLQLTLWRPCWLTRTKEAFPHTGNYFFFFHASSAKKEKNLIFFVNQHSKPRIQEKSESAGVLLRELKKMPLLLST